MHHQPDHFNLFFFYIFSKLLHCIDNENKRFGIYLKIRINKTLDAFVVHQNLQCLCWTNIKVTKIAYFYVKWVNQSEQQPQHIVCIWNVQQFIWYFLLNSLLFFHSCFRFLCKSFAEFEIYCLKKAHSSRVKAKKNSAHTYTQNQSIE